MSYLTQAAIAQNNTMYNRVGQCAAQQQIENYDAWTQEHRREWAAAPGWDTAWESALALHAGEPNYDPGVDEAVVTDAMILSQVQAMTAP